MTEVTRVPIRPIAKGSLTKLWIGIVVAIVLGAGIAWAAVPKGVSVETLVEGTGPTPDIGDFVFVKYVGKLPDGTVFDQSQELPIPGGIFPEGNPFPVEEGATIPGFFEALQQVRKGGKYLVEIPSDLAYGDTPQPGSPIPPNTDLTFELEVVDFMAREEFEQRMGALQQMMQAQQQMGAGGEGVPAPQPQPQAAPAPLPAQ
ncbi:MAG: FKBP-type peptidyl-prolyl cis-trans isomerase [Pontixanthobacter sp.]